MFLPDERELARRSCPEMHLPMLLLSHCSPHLLKQRNEATDPASEDVVLPERSESYTADLSDLAVFLRPTQLMANYVSRELSRGRQRAPIYTTYIVPDLDEAPWPVPTAEHSAANARREGLR